MPVYSEIPDLNFFLYKSNKALLCWTSRDCQARNDKKFMGEFFLT